MTRDILNLAGFIITLLVVSAVAGGSGFLVGQAMYGNQIHVQVIERNNTIYQNLTVERECNMSVIIREIMVESPTTTSTTTSTTTTTIKYRMSSAPMFDLYNRSQMETHNEKCYLNYTVTYDMRWWSGVEYKYDMFDCDNLEEYIFGEVDDWTETKGVVRDVVQAYILWENKSLERVYP